ncbi:MAG: FtsW/RodA/SpoVE family cell cycle protein [Roseimicrobium sp.]
MHRLSMLVLLIAVSILAALGIVMLTSTSFYVDELGAETYVKVSHQARWLAFGIIAAGLAARFDYRWLYSIRKGLFGLSLVLLALCYWPFLAAPKNGASRWLSLHSLGLENPTFQPSELAKLALAIILAGWFSRHAPSTKELKDGFLIPGLMIAATLALIAFEVDLGTAALVAALGTSMMFVAGTRWLYLLPTVGAVVGAFYIAVQSMPNRVERLLAFMNLEKYKDGLGLQQWRALIALGSGGQSGAGLGDGRMKRGFLPESVTDFIFPNIGEEFGLGGTVLVVTLFLLLAIAGIAIAHRAADRFGQLLAFGITLTLSLEALINMGVTTALLPNKGLPLPFVSYGGSNLLFAMVSIGILINIHLQSPLVARKNLLDTRRRGMRPAVT